LKISICLLHTVEVGFEEGDEDPSVLQYLSAEADCRRDGRVGCPTPPIFIKLKSGLTNNKFWEQQFFHVSGEWECPEGIVLPKNRRMLRTWRLLRPDRCEPPSISITDREDVGRISEKFEEIDFDTLVTDETMRRFLGYTILENKKTVTKRGAVHKKGDAPQSPRQAALKRTSEPATTSTDEVPLKKKKKQYIPLAASGARRTPPKSPALETNTEEGSMSFQGFGPEVSPTRGTGASQSFHLRDEASSEASHNGSESNCEDQDVPGTTILVPIRVEREEEPIPEASPEPTQLRVKHMAQKRKFGP
jgi:hypothetical protein